MENFEQNDLRGVLRPTRGGQTHRWHYPSVLGASEPTRINSLAPFATSALASTGAMSAMTANLKPFNDITISATFVASTSGLGTFIEPADPFHPFEGWDVVVWPTADRDESPSDLARITPQYQRRPARIAWTRPVQARLGVEIAPEVEAFTRAFGASRDVSIVAELCLRIVPNAKRVSASLHRDPEDGSTGVHFRVWTTSSPDVVVGAEDDLHQALFDRIPPERRSQFSFGYEYIN